MGWSCCAKAQPRGRAHAGAGAQATASFAGRALGPLCRALLRLLLAILALLRAVLHHAAPNKGDGLGVVGAPAARAATAAATIVLFICKGQRARATRCAAQSYHRWAGGQATRQLLGTT